MAFVCRIFLLTFILVAAAAAPAAASPVLVFDDGRVTVEDDPYLPPRAATELPAVPRGLGPPELRLAGAAQAASVRTAIQKAYSTGRIGAAKRDRFLAIYDEAISTSR